MGKKSKAHKLKIDLTKRDLTKPIVLSHLRGTYDNPIIVICDKTISVNTFGRDPAQAANRIAYLRQENGFFPSIGQVGDQAALALVDCQFVVVKGIKFDQCWPTALDINNCQNIVVVDCKFGSASIAIGANGIDTRDIWIERCKFKQTNKRELWDKITWAQVHGSYENSTAGGVIDSDQRHYDGDFFRAWNIAGNVTIRDCDIKDAFNGIHFFNTEDDISPDTNRSAVKFNNGRRSASNVLIENNRFVRVRDNCIEPEDHAWNWVVRSNTFDNCYAPYSFELKRAGWFYVYDNHHWLDERAKVGRSGSSGFKLSGAQKNEGDFYIFNNSWLFKFNERLFRKNALGRMKHHNNAVLWLDAKGRLFGSGWNKPAGVINDPGKEENKRFTRRWKQFCIEMDGDWIHNDHGFKLENYRLAGYDLGKQTSSNRPGYNKATRRPGHKKRQKWLEPSPAMLAAGVSWTMRMPGYKEAGRGEVNFQEKYQFEFPAGFGVGAGLSETKLAELKQQLRFVPDFPVRPKKSVTRLV